MAFPIEEGAWFSILTVRTVIRDSDSLVSRDAKISYEIDII